MTTARLFKKWTQEERDKLPLADYGDPERRLFPIADQDDVDSAARLIGRAQNPEAVKRRIVAICKRKGLKPPDAWAGNHTASLGGQQTVTEQRAVAVFDLATAGRYVEGEWAVYPNALLFEAGAYPDKGFELTPEEQWAAVETFRPIAGNIEHTEFLRGRACHVPRIFLDPHNSTQLRGEVRVPLWLDENLADHEKRLSCEWTRDEQNKQLVGLGLVVNPRVPDAALMSAYVAAFAGKRHSGQDMADLQMIHDIAVKQGARCPDEMESSVSTNDSAGDFTTELRTFVDDLASGTNASRRTAKKEPRMSFKDNVARWFSQGMPDDFNPDGSSAATQAAAPAAQPASPPPLAPSVVAVTETAEFKAAQEEISRLREVNARATAERIQSDATHKAEALVLASKILPAQQAAVAALFAQAKADDSAGVATFGTGTQSREALLDTLFGEAMAPHQLTQQAVTPEQQQATQAATATAQGQALFNQQTTRQAGDPKPLDDAERRRLHSMTPLGRTILAEQQSNGHSKE